MNQERLRKLLEFLNKDPNDPFTLYAIALEYATSNDSQAGKYFDRLLISHSDYLPAYYHSAQYFAEAGENDKAKLIYHKGIKLATRQKEEKTLNELKAAYANFLFETEEED